MLPLALEDGPSPTALRQGLVATSFDVVVLSLAARKNVGGATTGLVNINEKLWEITILMGKSTISMAMFNSKLLVYQRVFCV